MIEAVLFDLYGTLINIETDESDPSLYETLSLYARYRGIAIDAPDLQREYRSRVDAALSEKKTEFPEVDVTSVFMGIAQEYGGTRCDKQTAIDLAVLFRVLSIKRFGLYDGVPKVLSSLSRTYRLAVVSDAQWVFTEREMEIANLSRFFPVTVLSSRYGRRKPDTRLFRSALEQTGAAAGHAVYIGNVATTDLLGAKRAGLKCILFRNEYRSYEGVWPDACFDNYSRLEGIIELLAGQSGNADSKE